MSADTIRYSIDRINVYKLNALWPPQYLGRTLVLPGDHYRQWGKTFRKRDRKKTILSVASKSRYGWKIHKLLNESLAELYSDGPVSWDRKAKRIYFNGQADEGKSDRRCIYFADASPNWAGSPECEEIMLFSKPYPVSDPAISKNGQYMIFAAQHPAGQGGWDLFMVEKEGDQWSTPKNLGDKINSTGDERFPQFGPQDQLFFSSNGQAEKLGGFDLYVSQMRENEPGKPELLPYPLNTIHDEFALVTHSFRAIGDPDGQFRAFINSNRPFDKETPERRLSVYEITEQRWFTGIVENKRAFEPLEGANVKVTFDKGKSIQLITDADGKFFFNPLAYGNSRYFKITVSYPKLDTVSKSWLDIYDTGILFKLERTEYYELDLTILSHKGNNPVPNAIITLVRDSLDTLVFRGDTEGHFNREVKPGSHYQVQVEANGCRPWFYSFYAHKKRRRRDAQNPRLKYIPGSPYRLQVMKDGQQQSLEDFKIMVWEVGSRGKEMTALKDTDPDSTFAYLLPAGKQIALLALDAKSKQIGVGRFMVPVEEARLPGIFNSQTITTIPLSKGSELFSFYYEKDPILLQAGIYADMQIALALLKELPGLTIKLNVHTDSRGSGSANAAASREAAAFAQDFFKIKGIDKKRVSGRGYGEQKILNRCRNGVDCTEAEHQVNQRVEILVSDFEDLPPMPADSVSGSNQ